MSEVAIVTLTRFPDIFAELAASVDLYEPDRRKIVVTSGGANIERAGWEVVRGEEPFITGRNMNAGLAAAGDADVLLVNDDVRLLGETIAPLARLCAENPAIAAITPQVKGDIGNPLARVSYRIEGEWIAADMLPFVCVFLPRRALAAVGPLREDFMGYAGEDEEWWIRAMRLGWKLAITPLVRVRHGHGAHRASSSFLRVMTEEQRVASLAVSRAQVRAIHG